MMTVPDLPTAEVQIDGWSDSNRVGHRQVGMIVQFREKLEDDIASKREARHSGRRMAAEVLYPAQSIGKVGGTTRMGSPVGTTDTLFATTQVDSEYVLTLCREFGGNPLHVSRTVRSSQAMDQYAGRSILLRESIFKDKQVLTVLQLDDVVACSRRSETTGEKCAKHGLAVRALGGPVRMKLQRRLVHVLIVTV